MESGRGGGREEGIRVIALLPTVCVSRITTAASTNKLEHALAISVMEFGRRENICIALECRDERLGEYMLHFCCVQCVNAFASSGKQML